MSDTFESWPERKQVAALRDLARILLVQYGMRSPTLTLLQHGYNTTFGVSAKGQRYALRINVNSTKGTEEIAAEGQWLQALAGAGFPVPTPVLTLEGGLVSSARFEPLSRVVYAALHSWLPGSILDRAPTPTKWQRAGELLADVQAFSRVWKPMAPARLRRIDKSVAGEGYKINKVDHPALSKQLKRDCAKVLKLSDQALAEFGQRETLQPIHSDFHGGNLMAYRGRIAAFDFDDGGIGLPTQDVANAIYFLRDNPTLEAAFRKGYTKAGGTSLAFQPELKPHFEALVAARTLLVLNDLVTSTNPEHFAHVPEFARRAEHRLHRFLKGGEFALDIPEGESLIPQGVTPPRKGA